MNVSTTTVLRSVPCPKCDVPAGSRCRRSTGQVAPYEHVARWYVAKDRGLFPPEVLAELMEQPMEPEPVRRRKRRKAKPRRRTA